MFKGRNASQLVSVIQNPKLSYPGADYFFSPDERYPEYPFGSISTRPNSVYRAIRECFRQAGLDATNFGTSGWNPLGKYFNKGESVFLLCNFVYHRRRHESLENFFSKCTHGSVIRAAIDYTLIAVGEKGKVRFGNAPLQSCIWEQVLRDTGGLSLISFYEKEAPGLVEACDLRSFKVVIGSFGEVKKTIDKRGSGNEIPVDMGKDSLLEALYTTDVSPVFRITDYRQTETEECHARGKHIYYPARKIIEADHLFSIPKLKTHEKVLATLGIKGCVGGIAVKQCLAHHRKGSPVNYGDEYPDHQWLSRMESDLGEAAMRSKPCIARYFFQAINRGLRKINRLAGGIAAGAWRGNDTAWRMAIDIARLFAYVDNLGKLREMPFRNHIVLVDGIIAGEGQGPLSPLARHHGFLLIADDIVVGDYVAAKFMGLDPENIPIVREAFEKYKYPLTQASLGKFDVTVNGVSMNVMSAGCTIRPFREPLGW
jgi:uncharacterized protein (DUF362 family)